jgi:SAM-dependent methyltransferase
MAEQWFEKWFSSKLYLEIYKHRDLTDAQNLINLIQRQININPAPKVLDVCCGEGRHSIELAKRGYDVTGFDLSKFLINKANENSVQSKEKDLKVKFLIKDMRNFNFYSSFDIAVNLFSSFGYFQNDTDNYKVIRNISESLKQGGWFIFDFLNSYYLKKNLVPVSKSRIGKISVLQKRRIENKFIIKDIIIKKNKKELFFNETVKLYNLKDFKRIFGIYGFKIKKIFGDYYGNKFNLKSSRLIIFAQKN